MAYYSKYTGKELEERLDRINDIPTLINKLFLDKEYLTELDVKCLIKEMIPTFYEGIPIDNKTIYWENGVLKSLGTGGGEGGGGCDCPELWEVKEVNGQQYLYSRLPIATQGGITMYANGGGINIPSIYAGIPVDETTITKRKDGTLMVNPNIELGGASNWDELEGKPSWVTDSKPKYSYNEIEGAPDLSKLVTRNTDQIISGYKNFEKGLAINGLSITNTKDDIIYLDANLVIRGGLVIYADDTVDVPNLIDSLPKASYEVPGLAAFDSTYFVVDINGKVTLIPDNVGLNETELYSYLTSNRYATQEWVTSKNYATIGALNTLEDKIDSFLEGSDTDTIINKWKELEVFLNGLSESDNLATILQSKVGKDYVDGNFVTLGTAQSILGEKDFVGGLKVNGSPIYYDTEKKYWKFEGDLLVTGGVTMYGNEGTYTPSTIMDAILYDDATLGINSNGELYVKGSIGGQITFKDIANVGAWADSVADVDRIMYQQAGSSNWVAKSLSSIGGGGGVSGDYLPLSGGELNNGSNRDLLALNTTNTAGPTIQLKVSNETKLVIGVAPSTNYGAFFTYLGSNIALLLGHDGKLYLSTDVEYFKNKHELIHSGNYSSYALPLDGSASMKGSINWGNKVYISGLSHAALRIDTPSGYIQLGPQNTSYCHIYTDRDSFYFNKSLLYANGNTIWHSGNDGSGSGLDADLLDGYNIGSIVHYADVYDSGTVGLAKQAVTFWRRETSSGYTDTYGTSLHLFGAYSWANRLDISTSGNIFLYQGINTTNMTKIGQIAMTHSNVASATKLQTARTIWGQSFDGSGDVNGNISNTNNITPSKNSSYDIGSNSNQYRAMYASWFGAKTGNTLSFGANDGTHIFINSSGNVGIGTTSPAYKLDVNGTVSGARIEATKGESHFSTQGGYIDPIPGVDAAIKIGGNFGQTGGNALLCTTSGSVGIGTTSPAYKLDVNGQIRATGWVRSNKGVHIDGSGVHYTNNGSFAEIASNGNEIVIASTTSDMYVNYRTSAVRENTVKTWIWCSGTGSSRANFQIGDLLCSGGVTMYSDQRKKTILNHVELSLKQIAEAPLIEHYYNSDDKKTTHVGSIAQYWASMNDWFCKLDSEGYYTMEIQNCALASAISIARELDRYESKTDKTINKLKKKIALLEEEVEQLRSRL